LWETASFASADPFYLYGDLGYSPPSTPYVLAGYKGTLTRAQNAFNQRMSKLRICVEWAFGRVLQQFAFVDYKKNLKLWLQCVGDYYKVAVLLANCLTCMRGFNETSEYFQCKPPTLEQYLKP